MLKIRFRFMSIAVLIMACVISSLASVDSTFVNKAKLEKSQKNLSSQIVKNALKAKDGRIISAATTDSNGKEHLLNFTYNSAGLSSLSNETGEKIELLRDSNKNLVGYIFPNGSKLLLNQSGSKANQFLTYKDKVVCAGKNATLYLNTPNITALEGTEQTACEAAVDIAVELGIHASYACAQGDLYHCAVIGAAAAAATAHAVYVCTKAGILYVRNKIRQRIRANSPCSNQSSTSGGFGTQELAFSLSVDNSLNSSTPCADDFGELDDWGFDY